MKIIPIKPFGVISLIKNSLKRFSVPPYHLEYDVNGEEHSFTFNDKNIIQCKICKWKFKELNQYEKYDPEIGRIIEIRDKFRKVSQEELNKTLKEDKTINRDNNFN